jgi:hypothetical protein
MAAVECGLCGWTEEIDEDLRPDQIEARAVDKYSRHMWEVHPQAAPYDNIAALWVQAQANKIAKTNGALTHSHD